MGSSKTTELLAAAGRGDMVRLRALLPVAGEPSAVVTPLMLAAAGGHAAEVERLLERGNDPGRRRDPLRRMA